MKPHLPRHHPEDKPPPRPPRLSLNGPVLWMAICLGECDQYPHKAEAREVAPEGLIPLEPVQVVAQSGKGLSPAPEEQPH
ncbi:hypothetical protein ACIGXF_15165 [Streptomyces sp. NPDC053086]|uniref:hypothetical protein n=1 Tax=unclassified Streptomyces TaxID=2593676 RepID=UPI0037D0A0DC